MNKRLWIVGALVLGLAGCGGGGAPATEDAGRDQNYGPVSTRAVGGVQQPVTMVGSNSGVTGVFGANFTNVTVNMVPENQLNEDALDFQSYLSFCFENRPRLIDMSDGSISSPNPMFGQLSNACDPQFSAGGGQLVTSEFDPSTSFFEIFTINVDGSGRFKVTSGPGSKFAPALSPTASKIAFYQYGDIWTINTNGTGLTQLTNNADVETYPRFSPDGTKIGYLRQVGSSTEFWTMTSAGATQSMAYNLLPIAGWDWHPNGTEIVIGATSGGSTYGVARATLNPVSTRWIQTTNAPPYRITYSPTGARVAYEDYPPSGGLIQIVKVQDHSVSTLRPLATSEYLGDWGPLPRKRQFVGAGGLFHTNAAGFLYGMRYDEFRSILAFDAVTRSTVDIDVEPTNGLNPTNFFATITAADSINMLRYVNNYFTPKITVVDPAVATTHLQGAIVSYNALTGRVAAVVGFNRSRGGAKPARTNLGAETLYTGDFVAAYDADGRKVRGPTSQVTFDAEGKLVRG